MRTNKEYFYVIASKVVENNLYYLAHSYNITCSYQKQKVQWLFSASILQGIHVIYHKKKNLIKTIGIINNNKYY